MLQTIPYLFFDGNAREAVTFYSKCLDAEPYIQSFGEAPCPGLPPEASNRVMHARLTKGAKVFLMVSDIMPRPGQSFQRGNGFSVNIACESLEEIEKLFTALSENGKVDMPLQDTFWGARFGMLTDQFGVEWMLNFEHPKQSE